MERIDNIQAFDTTYRVVITHQDGEHTGGYFVVYHNNDKLAFILSVLSKFEEMRTRKLPTIRENGHTYYSVGFTAPTEVFSKFEEYVQNH